MKLSCSHALCRWGLPLVAVAALLVSAPGPVAADAGAHVTATFHDADAITVLRVLAQLGELSIVFDTRLADEPALVTAVLKDVPVLDALRAVAHAVGWEVVLEGSQDRKHRICRVGR